MQYRKRVAAILFALIAGIVLVVCSGRPAAPKYVFLFIGDGMGLAQVTAAQRYLQVTGGDSLVFTRMPVMGRATTHSANSLVTCSAAAATALATGHKTRNGVVGLSADRETTYTTICEAAKAAGYKTGVVTSVSLDHATPACFYAHQKNRNMYYGIGRDLMNSSLDFAGGGGLKNTEKEGEPDLLDIARQKGVTVVTDRDGFDALKPGSGRIVAMNGTLTEKKALPYEIDRAPDDLSLADYTRKAIGMLENDDGFFLMVEGGKIDWACHVNDAASAVQGVLAFDRAVREGLAFLKKHPRETLVLITADHETGGMGLNGREAGLGDIGRLRQQTMSGQRFLDLTREYRENTPLRKVRIRDLLPQIEAAFGLKPLAPGEEKKLEKKALAWDWKARGKLNRSLRADDLKTLQEALEISITETEEARKSRSSFYRRRFGGYDTFLVTMNRMAGSKAGLGFTTYSHTGIPVPVYAGGAGAERFSGQLDNTDIPKRIAALMGVEL